MVDQTRRAHPNVAVRPTVAPPDLGHLCSTGAIAGPPMPLGNLIVAPPNIWLRRSLRWVASISLIVLFEPPFSSPLSAKHP